MFKKNFVSFDECIKEFIFDSKESLELVEAVMSLPEKYKIVIHLFYYEDYSVKEIVDILKISQSNVKVRLLRGRTLLKNSVLEGWEDE